MARGRARGCLYRVTKKQLRKANLLLTLSKGLHLHWRISRSLNLNKNFENTLIFVFTVKPVTLQGIKKEVRNG